MEAKWRRGAGRLLIRSVTYRLPGSQSLGRASQDLGVGEYSAGIYPIPIPSLHCSTGGSLQPHNLEKLNELQTDPGFNADDVSGGGQSAGEYQAGDSRPKPNNVVFHDFAFGDGEHLASLTLHYITLGKPRRDASGAIANGVLLLHGTAGSSADLVTPAFVDALYGAGEPLDLRLYFLVIPDVIGAGESSKPSDGLHASFPRYGYKDQVRAQHQMLEQIGIKHLKVVLGTSMGGMQTWFWGEMYPNDMDCLVAIATTPAAISGRNMVWREMVSQAIRGDPAWQNGQLFQGLAAKNLDQCGRTVIRDHDGLS